MTTPSVTFSGLTGAQVRPPGSRLQPGATCVSVLPPASLRRQVRSPFFHVWGEVSLMAQSSGAKQAGKEGGGQVGEDLGGQAGEEGGGQAGLHPGPSALAWRPRGFLVCPQRRLSLVPGLLGDAPGHAAGPHGAHSCEIHDERSFSSARSSSAPQPRASGASALLRGGVEPAARSGSRGDGGDRPERHGQVRRIFKGRSKNMGVCRGSSRVDFPEPQDDPQRCWHLLGAEGKPRRGMQGWTWGPTAGSERGGASAQGRGSRSTAPCPRRAACPQTQTPLV